VYYLVFFFQLKEDFLHIVILFRLASTRTKENSRVKMLNFRNKLYTPGGISAKGHNYV